MIDFPDSPRYLYAKQTAIDCIISCNYVGIPMSPCGVMKQILGKNVKFAKYSKIAKKMKCTVDDICVGLQSKDAHGAIDNNGKLCISYNDEIYPNERINFTLAHELGHYMLGHYNLNVDLTNLTEDQNYILEKEADAFAAELLVPHAVLYEWDKKRSINSSSIAYNFHISQQAAEYICNTIHYKENKTLNDYRKIELFTALNSLIPKKY